MILINLTFYKWLIFRPFKVIYITLVCALLFSSLALFLFVKFSSSGTTQPSTSDPIIRSLDDSHEEQAIAAAENYLVDTLHIIRTDVRFVLDYLERKYGISPEFSAKTNPIVVREDESFSKANNLWKRIAYPDQLVSILPEGPLDTTIKMSIHAANCDHIPLPRDFTELIKTNVQSGGYELTHVALAYRFMKDNGCELPDDSAAILRLTSEKLVNIASSQSSIADLRYEAIAFLSLINRADLVERDWIDRLLDEQRDDGGWSQEADKGRSNDHATVLALWALLQHARPNPSNEPIIRRPSS